MPENTHFRKLRQAFEATNSGERLWNRLGLLAGFGNNGVTPSEHYKELVTRFSVGQFDGGLSSFVDGDYPNWLASMANSLQAWNASCEDIAATSCRRSSVFSMVDIFAKHSVLAWNRANVFCFDAVVVNCERNKASHRLTIQLFQLNLNRIERPRCFPIK